MHPRRQPETPNASASKTTKYSLPHSHAHLATATFRHTGVRIYELAEWCQESIRHNVSTVPDTFSATRALLLWLGVKPRIGRRRTPHGSGLGKVRWVVERTISWRKGLRRLRIRYDRPKDVQHAWNSLAASVICFRLAQEDYMIAA